jgi:hypothetical protein
MDVLCPLDALLKCGGFCKPLKDAMKSGLLSHQQEMTSRTTPTKRMWLSDLIVCFLAVLTVATLLLIANFGLGAGEMAP